MGIPAEAHLAGRDGLPAILLNGVQRGGKLDQVP